jgi:hypothetical protein
LVLILNKQNKSLAEIKKNLNDLLSSKNMAQIIEIYNVEIPSIIWNKNKKEEKIEDIVGE